MKPVKIIQRVKKFFKFHNRHLYLGESGESESWLQYASIAFQCDPDKLRKEILTKRQN